jgi:hypothetical protein
MQCMVEGHCECHDDCPMSENKIASDMLSGLTMPLYDDNGDREEVIKYLNKLGMQGFRYM